ncbi:short-chain dehydrogenase [Colletotrichum orchidophilum]|uniref:Short-chain dehydrogenase n=1 Tax=Colletotrichum orchidophilum TaxID=1209926 RepID=A0A1G4BTV5_9PEZI|nr:short-chain dehydrogenase [Colletotrichum orchidophilum]OHF04687.1 short-chain dehydrogenase [Colletotrichum orchidophilum]
MASLLRGTAFITGAASGIGQKTALSFARNGMTRLALTDINLEALEATRALLRREYPNTEVLALPLNVRDASEVRSGIAETVSRFGRLDVAVNNAGIAGAGQLTHEIDEEEFSKIVDVDLYGVWRCQKEEIKVMLNQEDLGMRRGRGAIINVASIFGIVSPSVFMAQTAYSTAKHGNDANNYGRRGIRINAICPGWIETPISDRFPQEAGSPLSRYIESTPLQRLGQPEEIADCIAFLASDMSSYMQGSGLVADGGFTAH